MISESLFDRLSLHMRTREARGASAEELALLAEAMTEIERLRLMRETSQEVLRECMAELREAREENLALREQDVPPLLAEFARDMLPALGEGWESYVAPLESITPTWPTNKRECANRPEYARKYMLDTAKSAADLLLLWLVLRRIAQAGGEVSL